MNCVHEEIRPGVWFCPVCEHPAITSHPPKIECGTWKLKAIRQATPTKRPEFPVRSIVCQHRGPLIREEDCKPCQTSTGKPMVEVYSCGQFGECTQNNTSIQPRIKACSTCQVYTPLVQLPTPSPTKVRSVPREEFEVVPSRGGPWAWRGISKRKPWEYNVTAIIPVVQPDETLPIVIELLRLQTERPYILIIDTGSDPQKCEWLETLRAADVEIHYIKNHGTVHLAECVAMACDFGVARALTRYTFFTHSDCFVRDREGLRKLMELAENHIVAGHQITERKYEGWETEFGHTFLMCDQDELDRRGITWKMRRGVLTPGAVPPGTTDYTAEGLPPHIVDTERSFNRLLRAAGIPGHFTGGEKNWQRNKDKWIDHVRSLPGSRLYSDEYQAKAMQWLPAAVAEAKQRIVNWRAQNENTV